MNALKTLYEKIDGWLVLRIGIAYVLFWFGINQLIAPERWVYFLPETLRALFPVSPEVLVLINGGVEVVFGCLILFGIWLRVSALLMGLHLLAIAISLGNSPSGARDFGLALATLALVFKR